MNYRVLVARGGPEGASVMRARATTFLGQTLLLRWPGSSWITMRGSVVEAAVVSKAPL